MFEVRNCITIWQEEKYLFGKDFYLIIQDISTLYIASLQLCVYSYVVIVLEAFAQKKKKKVCVIGRFLRLEVKQIVTTLISFQLILERILSYEMLIRKNV